MTIEDADRARHLASSLLDIGAVSLQPDEPFTWSSGLVSPIYCDNRRTLGHPRVRRAIADGFAELVRSRGLMPVTIAGTATAGIPHAAWLAERLDAPMVYVRSQTKGHGQGQRIEGADLGTQDDVIIVEDLVSTGGSALDAVSAVRETGATVRGVLAIFSYGLDRAATAFEDADVPLSVLTNFHVLLEVARAEGRLSDAGRVVLDAWRSDPEAWSREHSG